MLAPVFVTAPPYQKKKLMDLPSNVPMWQAKGTAKPFHFTDGQLVPASKALNKKRNNALTRGLSIAILQRSVLLPLLVGKVESMPCCLDSLSCMTS